MRVALTTSGERRQWKLIDTRVSLVTAPVWPKTGRKNSTNRQIEHSNRDIFTESQHSFPPISRHRRSIPEWNQTFFCSSLPSRIRYRNPKPKKLIRRFRRETRIRIPDATHRLLNETTFPDDNLIGCLRDGPVVLLILRSINFRPLRCPGAPLLHSWDAYCRPDFYEPPARRYSGVRQLSMTNRIVGIRRFFYDRRSWMNPRCQCKPNIAMQRRMVSYRRNVT